MGPRRRSAGPPRVRPRGGRVDDGEQPEELESVETSGASVDEAIQKALELLDLTEDDVEVEVLRAPGPAQPALVRVTALPYEEDEYEEEAEEEGEGEEIEGEAAEEYEELPLTETANTALELLEQTLDLMG